MVFRFLFVNFLVFGLMRWCILKFGILLDFFDIIFFREFLFVWVFLRVLFDVFFFLGCGE